MNSRVDFKRADVRVRRARQRAIPRHAAVPAGRRNYKYGPRSVSWLDAGRPSAGDEGRSFDVFVAVDDASALERRQDPRARGRGPEARPQCARRADLSELGLPGFESNTWFGLVASSKVPRDVLNKIRTDVAQAMRSPAVLKRINDIKSIAVGNTSEGVPQDHPLGLRDLQGGHRQREISGLAHPDRLPVTCWRSAPLEMEM